MARPSNETLNHAAEHALDRIDFALLAVLQNKARTSNKELAAGVGLAPSSCLTRVRRLERTLVRGYHAELDPLALGLQVQAMISVRLRLHTRAAFEAFERHLRALPEVVTFYSIGGEIDFLVHVAVADVRALQDLTRDAFTARDEVARITTSLVFEHRRSGFPLPAQGGAGAGAARARAPSARDAATGLQTQGGKTRSPRARRRRRRARAGSPR